MQSIVDDTWQFGVLNECNLVDVVRLVAPHQKVLVEVYEIGQELLSDKVCVDGGIIVFNMDHILVVVLLLHLS